VSEALKQSLASIAQMMQSADIDHRLLTAQEVDPAWFADYNHQRIVNRFLFNYIKIQDKIGSKLFRLLLEHWRELDADNMTMLDMLNRLEKLRIIESVEAWDKLREIRNAIAHEYPEELKTRLENIELALAGYLQLKRIIINIGSSRNSVGEFA
jgi:hypothetical protein